MLVLGHGDAADGRRVTPLPRPIQGLRSPPHRLANRYPLRAPHLARIRIFSPAALRAGRARDIAVRGEYGNLGPSCGVVSPVLRGGRAARLLAGRGPCPLQGGRSRRPAACRGLSPFRPAALGSRFDSGGCRSLEVESRTASASVPPHSFGSLEAHTSLASSPLARDSADAIRLSSGSICPSLVRRSGPAEIRRSRVCLPTPDSRCLSVPLYLR